MRKLINKFFKGTTKNNAEANDTTEAIIQYIENEPLAISKSNVLYGAPNELGGFFLLNTVVVGSFKIKTKKGVKLSVQGKDFEIELDSDMLELASEFTNVPKRYMTKIDFQIEKEDLGLLEKSKLTGFVLKTPKKDIDFEICKELRKSGNNSEEE